MNKKPLFTIITDTHLEEKNSKEIVDIFKQYIDWNQRLGLRVLYHAGDFFDERKSQSLRVLETALFKIFDMIREAEMELRIIPGNHDKVSYVSEKSYLDIFRDYITLVKTSQTFEEKDCRIHMIPFFKEDVYPHYLDQLLSSGNLNGESGRDYLITHIAIQGVKNNDGSEVDKDHGVGSKIFRNFDKVFVGHYHNKQKVGTNVYYIGSSMQRSFGEDSEKGFTIVYEDGSHELQQLDFTKYLTVEIDLNEKKMKEVIALKDEYSKSSENIRFKFTGSEERVKSLDKSFFEDVGIKVKCESDKIEKDSSEKSVEFEVFNDSSLKEEFKNFCKENDLNNKEGLKYLFEE